MNANEIIKRIDEICDKAEGRDLTEIEAEEVERLTDRLEAILDQ